MKKIKDGEIAENSLLNRNLKLNMGCGLNKKNGYVNVDKFVECQPDIQMDLDVLPWEFEDNSVDEVLFNHSLEHIGANSDTFLGIMKELYRIARSGAILQINVPHPRHDNFIGDPTHVRVISPQVLSLFSKKNNNLWKQQGGANSPLALYLDVDFETIRVEQVITASYMNKLNSGELSYDELNQKITNLNNVVEEYKITLKVIK